MIKNLRNISIIIIIEIGIGLVTTQISPIGLDHPTQPQNPFAFNVAGFQVTPDQVTKILATTAKTVEKTVQKSRTKRNLNIKILEQELINLGKKKDLGRIGKNEFEQACKTINAKIEHLRKEGDDDSKSADVVANNIQHAILGGWQTLLDNYKEEQQRKTQVAVAAASKDVENKGLIEKTKLEIKGSMEKLKFMSTPQNLKSYSLFLAAASFGIVGGYYSLKLGYKYFESKLDKKPLLVRETSRMGWFEHFIEYFTSFFVTSKLQPTFEETIVLEPKLEQELKTFTHKTITNHEKGLPYPSLLLYGPSGTGKTLFAKYLSQISGLPYAIIKTSDLAQFAEGKDIEELNKLFEWAKNNTKGTILFFDEIDSLGRHRGKLSERWVRVLNAYLPLCSTSSSKILIVGATNRVEDLDPAFLQRFPKQIEVPLPGLKERERIIQLYIKKYIINDERIIKQNGQEVEVQLSIAKDVSSELIKKAADQTEGFSGRQIEQIISEMRGNCYLTDELTLTKEIFSQTLQSAILNKKKVDTITQGTTVDKKEKPLRIDIPSQTR